MTRYLIKIRRYKDGVNGSTRHRFSTKVKAILFAAGYQSGLYDSGNTDIYVSVWKISNDGAELVLDASHLEEIARKEV